MSHVSVAGRKTNISLLNGSTCTIYIMSGSFRISFQAPILYFPSITLFPKQIQELAIKWFSGGLPWWRSGWESACQCRGHGFVLRSGRIPHAAERLGPWATTTEPAGLEPVLRNGRGRDSERPAHRDEEWPPPAATGESPRTETKTQHSQKWIKKKKKKWFSGRVTKVKLSLWKLRKGESRYLQPLLPPSITLPKVDTLSCEKNVMWLNPHIYVINLINHYLCQVLKVRLKHVGTLSLLIICCSFKPIFFNYYWVKLVFK